ncbi:MAG: NADH-quinone oxidoreductase subunit M [Proteobacteria bacterium]|nr:NADH-quinone oxidoreductase subunit M [Pseudomonadota bacterium]
MNFPLLSLVTYLPAVGALLMVLFVSGRNHHAVRYTALGIAVADFLLSLLILPYYQVSQSGFQLLEKSAWIKGMGIQYQMGVDGISLLLVLLTTFLGALAILSSFSAITERVKEYMACLLILQTGMIGVFFALDIVLFYVFWEVMLIPMALLIGVWGGKRRIYAAVKFFLYTLVGSLFMLIGFLVVFFAHGGATGVYTFDLIRLMKAALPYDIQVWGFWALFLGFAIKVPLFPFHTWLPDAHVEAPTAGSVILAGVLLKMGTYGFVRFSLGLFPQAALKAIPAILTLAVIGIIYGALVAWVQPDVKKLVAYSSVSHLGFVVLGLFTVTVQGIQGGVLQMINHGLSTGALFLLVGVLYERRHTRMLDQFGGLAAKMPVFAGILGIVTFSSIGLPGLNGFIGEFLILLGAFQAKQFVFGALAATGVVLGAVYMLHMYKKVMFGKITREENQNITDMNQREILVLAPILVLIFWIGLYPMPFLRVMEPAVNDIVARLEVHEPGRMGSSPHAAIINSPLSEDGRIADLQWETDDPTSAIKE